MSSNQINVDEFSPSTMYALQNTIPPTGPQVLRVPNEFQTDYRPAAFGSTYAPSTSVTNNFRVDAIINQDGIQNFLPSFSFQSY